VNSIIFIMGVAVMALALDRIRASVANLTTVTTSAVQLLSMVAQEIRNNADDGDALNALADDIDSDASNLAQAMVANTPAASGESGDGFPVQGTESASPASTTSPESNVGGEAAPAGNESSGVTQPIDFNALDEGDDVAPNASNTYGDDTSNPAA
jgi:hypothetical protein